MTTRVWFEYAWQHPDDPHGEWHRGRFSKRRDLALEAEPTDEAMAREYLIVICGRWRTGTRFRLVRMTEQIFDDPEQEVRTFG